MARGTNSKRTAAEAPPVAPPVETDRAALTTAGLARAILAREFRPRVAEVRRLAEAVLAKPGKGKKARKKDGKKRKLAKIPGQKTRK